MFATRLNPLLTSITILVVMAAGLPAHAVTDLIVESDELVVVCNDTLESCALPGAGYEDFQISADKATFRLTGQELPAGGKRLRGHGIRSISWEPHDGYTAVVVEFDRQPGFNLINAVAGTELRPQTPQVIAGFGFEPREEQRSYPVLGSREPGELTDTDEHGTFELPDMPAAKYSDVLVSLQVRNVDFRDVLWYMSEIGGVSMVLDPYWDDEPTGNRRPVGGGGGLPPGGGGGGGGGFRPAGDFMPTIPRSGTGRLTMNLDGVPFDTALELILICVGLVKVDIYPGSFDQ